MIHPDWIGPEKHIFPKWLGGIGEVIKEYAVRIKCFSLRIARKVGFDLER